MLVHQLIPNEDVRRMVEQVTKSSKAEALAEKKETKRPALSLTAELKDRFGLRNSESD